MILLLLVITFLSRPIFTTQGLSAIPSPCPGTFLYEPQTERNRWYGYVYIKTDEDLLGVIISLKLDSKAELLGNWFGETVSTDNQPFNIQNPDYSLEAGPAVAIRFFVQFDASRPIPLIHTIRLNGKKICSNSPKQKPTTPKIFISKPLNGSAFSYEPSDTSDENTDITTINRPSHSGGDRLNGESSQNHRFQTDNVSQKPSRVSDFNKKPMIRPSGESSSQDPYSKPHRSTNSQNDLNNGYEPAGNRDHSETDITTINRPSHSGGDRLNGESSQNHRFQTDNVSQKPSRVSDFNKNGESSSQDPYSKPHRSTNSQKDLNNGYEPAGNRDHSETDDKTREENERSDNRPSRTKVSQNPDRGAAKQDEINNKGSRRTEEHDITSENKTPISNRPNGKPNTNQGSINFNIPSYNTKTDNSDNRGNQDRDQSNDHLRPSKVDNSLADTAHVSPSRNNHATDSEEDVFPGDFNIHRPSPANPSESRHRPPNREKSVACGTIAFRPRPLITNGQDTVPGEWPWHTAIYRSKDIQLIYICGGSLISENFVLTAAHCVSRPRTNKIVEPESILLYFGKYNLKMFGQETQERDVSDIYLHPQFNSSFFYNDIALLKTTTAIKITDFVRPVCLWEGDTNLENVVNKQGTVIGWGFDENKKISEKLMQAKMPIVSTIKCIYSNRDFFSQFTFDKNFCAGFRNGTSVCNGDSGGSMVFPRSGTTGQQTVWQIRGLVSVGVALQSEGICDTSHYVIFTDVAKYTNWIHQILNS